MKSLQCGARGTENKKRGQRSPVLELRLSFCRTPPAKSGAEERQKYQYGIKAAQKRHCALHPVLSPQDTGPHQVYRSQINSVISNVNKETRGIFMAFGL